MVTPKECQILLKIARTAIEKTLNNEQIELNPEVKKKFNYSRGLFVTLHYKKLIKGSVGYIMPPHDLLNTLILASQQAAFNDPRFPPVTSEQLADISITIEIIDSVDVADKKTILDKLDLTKEGVLVEFGPYSGSIMPLAAREANMTTEDALEQACIKANIAPDQWKKTSEIYTLKTEIIEEIQNAKIQSRI